MSTKVGCAKCPFFTSKQTFVIICEANKQHYKDNTICNKFYKSYCCNKYEECPYHHIMQEWYDNYYRLLDEKRGGD